MKVNGRISLVDGSYIDNMGCPSGNTFPVAQEAELFCLKGHSEKPDGLYLYLNGEWGSVGVAELETIGTAEQVMPMYVDPIRNKTLSGTVFPYVYNHIQAKSDTWFGVGSNVGASAGYIAPYNGTIVGITAQTQNGGNSTTIEIDVYIQTVRHQAVTSLVSVGGNLPVQSFNVGVNLDFNEGDLLQTRGNRTIGVSNMAEVTICLMVRWRA